MSAKKTILVLCDWFLPGYLAGGPIQSIATLTKQLGNDITFKIITTDRDFKANEPYNDITPNCWTNFEGRTVFYISPDKLHGDFLLKLIENTPHDCIYLNSLFSKHFTIAPLKWRLHGRIKSSVILAPRGMLGDGALAIKAFKKQLFLMYTKTFGLFKNVCWQSTSAQETLEIKKRIGKNARVLEAPNFPNPAGEVKTVLKEVNVLKLCFISRISEKKNLNFAIDILKEINTCKILFDVYGPVEDEIYWNACQQNTQELPPNVTFNYKGVLTPQQVGATFSQYHALFLPTKNENYGHIIVEALQHGRPVVLSDQTPWRGLSQQNVGFDIALTNKKEFVAAIMSFCHINQINFDNMALDCIIYIEQKLKVEEIKNCYLKIFAG